MPPVFGSGVAWELEGDFRQCGRVTSPRVRSDPRRCRFHLGDGLGELFLRLPQILIASGAILGPDLARASRSAFPSSRRIFSRSASAASSALCLLGLAGP